jgi:hypothetical protein
VLTGKYTLLHTFRNGGFEISVTIYSRYDEKYQDTYSFTRSFVRISDLSVGGDLAVKTGSLKQDPDLG